MAILFYLPEKKEAGARLYKIVKNVLAGKEIKLCKTIKDMTKCLHQKIAHFRIAVLYLETRRDILDVQSLSEYLGDVKLILVLPDGDPLTISQAHLLRPRFITYKDDPFDDLGTVLAKMTELYPASADEGAVAVKSKKAMH